MTDASPCIGVTATASGRGKTLVTLALIDYYRQRGNDVQSYKVGPDFIDPSYHRILTDRPVPNLDTWFQSPTKMADIMQEYGEGADVEVVEGVMGLMDGREGREPGKGSTMEVFRELEVPYVLVLDGSGRSHTLASAVRGIRELALELECLGVVINRVASERHERMLKQGIETWCDVPLLATFPETEELDWPSRHLGLHTNDIDQQAVRETVGEILVPRLNDRCLPEATGPANGQSPPDRFQNVGSGPRIGVARDEAFQFYYAENLRALTRRGARLVPVSPMRDSSLPEELDGLYLGGGYPEAHAGGLADNESFKKDLRHRMEQGLPVWAECGGLLYLGEQLPCEDDRDPVAGVGWFPFESRMNDRFQALSYVEGVSTERNPFCGEGEPLVGHEFHYASLEGDITGSFGFELQRGDGLGDRRDGFVRNRVMGLFTHAYFPACGDLVQGFHGACERYREERADGILSH